MTVEKSNRTRCVGTANGVGIVFEAEAVPIGRVHVLFVADYARDVGVGILVPPLEVANAIGVAQHECLWIDGSARTFHSGETAAFGPNEAAALIAAGVAQPA